MQSYGERTSTKKRSLSSAKFDGNFPQSQIPVFIKFHSGYLLIVLASTVENAHETTSWVKSEGFKKREIKNNLKK